MTPDREILRPAAMIAAARAETGLEDFGDMRWFEPASRWLDAVVQEAPLSMSGILGLHQAILAPMTTRLRVTDFLKRHPEVLEEDVSDPIIVVGLTRTGTTKLHRMLASDPEVQSLPLFRLANPVPLPGEREGESHLRMVAAQTMSASMREHFPDFFAAHPIIPDEPEEEAFLIEFDTQLSAWRAHAPSYWSWWLSRLPSERAHVYDYLRTVLQCVQWQDGGKRGRPFVLKSAIHLGEMRCLVEAFPHATIVHTHRDLETTLASTARIFELLMRFHSDDIDLMVVGDLVLDMYSRQTDQNLSDREHLGARLQTVDVDYEDIRTNCLGVIRRVWQRRGRNLSATDEAAIQGWLENNPQHRFGRHRYSLEPYGLTGERIAEAFKRYLDAFPQVASK